MTTPESFGTKLHELAESFHDATTECVWGASPPYLNTCEKDAVKGSDLCAYHKDVDTYLEELAASMPDDLDEVSVDDAPNPYEPDPNDPSFIAYQRSLELDAYRAWKADKLADDPDLTEDDLTEEAWSDDLLAAWEAINDPR